MTSPELSLVVTVRNEAARLPTLLDALGRQTLPTRRYELLVVDDASEDDTRAIAGRHPGAQVIALPAHAGLPAGRNVGVRWALAPVIVFTDGDCVPSADWLERGLERLRETGAEILAGGIDMPLSSHPSIAALVDATVYFDQEGYTRAGFGAGANLWISREVFERFGLFNERVGMYGDEAELCQRAVRGGARLVYAPDVSLVHPPRWRLRDLVRKSYLQGRGGAAHRRFGSGALHEQRPLFLSWRSYAPRRRIRGVDRLRRQAFQPSRSQLLGLYLGQYAMVRLPRLLGAVAGEVRHAVGGPARASSPQPPVLLPPLANGGEPSWLRSIRRD